MSDGWIKLHRCLLDKAIWECTTMEQKTILVVLLLLASHAEKQWMWKGQKFEIAPGQFVTSLESISSACGKGVSVQNVRTALKIFEKLEFLTNDSTKQGRLITITNWARYQLNDDKANKPPNSQLTDDQQTPNSQLTTIKKEKNVRMEEEEKTYSASDDAAHAGGNGSETFFLTRRKRKLKGKRLDTFNRFWEVFAYKRGKAEAADAWLDIPTLTESIVEQICAAAEVESKFRQQIVAEGRTPKMAQGWITGRRWEDEDMKPATQEDHLKAKYAAFLAEDEGGIVQ